MNHLDGTMVQYDDSKICNILQPNVLFPSFPHHFNCSRRGIDVFLRAFFACVLSFDEAVKSSMKPTVELVWRKSVQK